jgi:hypothetical protein
VSVSEFHLIFLLFYYSSLLFLCEVTVKFAEKWLGTYGPIRCPARSPDLTPLDFWLWDYFQDQVYLTQAE